jgi:type 1 glutamine amidotransferase
MSDRTVWSILGSVILCSGAYADERSYDPAMNVCRGTNPVCYHDWAAAQRKGNRVLLYTRTAAFRHPNLGPALAAGLNPPLGPDNVVQTALKDWLEKEGITVDWTEDVVAFANAKLNQYKAIVFASTSRDALWAHGRAMDPQFAVNTSTGAHLDAARTALRQYIRAGGGFVGVHSAVGTEYNWSWYEGLLGNSNFYDHGPFQAGTVVIRTRNDPSTNGLPRSWPFQDEWYQLEPFPTRVKFLAAVDDQSQAVRSTINPGNPRLHPVAWCQYYDGGRSWITTLGHDARAFTDGSGFPGQASFKQLVVNGIESAMGLSPFCT